MDEVSPIEQLEAIVRDIERTVQGFSISGPGVSGHIKDGYLVNARPGVNQAGEGTGGGGPPPPPPPPVGACCNGEDCSITTEAECAGSYQGDDTVCAPNPCITSPSGACCHYDSFGVAFCFETTEEACTANCGDPDLGYDCGEWQGDDTTCIDAHLPCTDRSGACCQFGFCHTYSPYYCDWIGGTYHGDDVLCEDVDCSLDP
jgi:hypothetical protein